jgi:signal transduction histidine kinase
MKLQIENRVRAGYVTVFLLLTMSYISFFISIRNLKEQVHLVQHTDSVIIRLQSLLSHVTDAETGLRGYLVVNDTNFLSVYRKSFPLLKQDFDALQELIKDNDIQQYRLKALKTRINEKYRIMTGTLTAFESNGQQITDSLITNSYYGKEVMDTIRELISRMEKDEKKLLLERAGNLNRVLKTLNLFISISIIIAVVLAVYSWVVYNKENRAKKIADAYTLQYRIKLEKKVDELNEANRQLKELKNMEKLAASGRIARQMAHEIRNPLTNIGLASEQLRSDTNSNAEQAIFFDMIDRNAKRINQLVSDLLNSTKFTQLQVEDISINDLIDEVLEDANDRLELKNIKLEKCYEDGMCMVSVDKERMKIALLNVIVNAIEAMEEEKGILKICTETIDKKCCVKIIDNGAGISKDALGKLFEPYFTGKPKGTGLGLTATQNIILNHKGVIDVESEEGKGSVFIITLNFLENCGQ